MDQARILREFADRIEINLIVATQSGGSPSRSRFQKYPERINQIQVLLDHRQGDVPGEEMAEIIGRSVRQAGEIFHGIVGESFRSAQLRARLSKQEKRRIVEETLRPGSSVSIVARQQDDLREPSPS